MTPKNVWCIQLLCAMALVTRWCMTPKNVWCIQPNLSGFPVLGWCMTPKNVWCIQHGNEADIWEAEIKDIRPIIIDEDILKGFGFRKGPHRTDWLYDVDDLQIVFDANPCSMNFFVRHQDGGTSPCFDSYYIHQLQDVYCRFTQKPLNLNWKGI